MKQLITAYIWLRIWGLVLCTLSIGAVLVLAEPQRLSYFSLLLFKHQEMLKTAAIFGIFTGVFFLFYTTSKIPERYLKLKFFKGPVKLHPDMIKQTLEQWFLDQKLTNVKLMSVTIESEEKIELELKTSNLQLALYSLEDIEMKLREFMSITLGIKTPLDLQLFEL